MKPESDWGYWMGWVTAAVVTALSLIALAAFMFARDIVCTGDLAEQCAREWISATGSWAALPAAVLTIAFLSRQIARADRHHRENVRLQVEYKYDIADVLISQCEDVNQQIDEVLAARDLEDDDEYSRLSDGILERVNLIYNEADAWDEFERSFVFHSRWFLSDIRDRIQSALEAPDLPTTVLDFRGSPLEKALVLIRDFNQEVALSCQRYIDRIDKIVA